jgi:putative membrane protein
MRFLKILFWILIGGLAAAFVIYNEAERVEIALWGNLVADVSLPILLVLVFLLGLIPMLIAYHTLRWRMRMRVNSLERTIGEMRQSQEPPPPPPAVDPGDLLVGVDPIGARA